MSIESMRLSTLSKQLNDITKQLNPTIDGYKFLATNNGSSLVQPVFAFDTNGITYSVGDIVTFTAKLITSSSNLSKINQTRWFINSDSTIDAISGSQTVSVTSQNMIANTTIPYTTSVAISAVNRYIHCFIDFALVVGTQNTDILIYDITLTINGKQATKLTNAALYNKNTTDAVVQVTKLDTTGGTTKKNLYGKKFNVIGDSMVHGHSVAFSSTWASLIANRNNMTVTDYGINGTCLAGSGNGYGDSVVDRYSSMSDGADYIGVFAGTNDQVSAIPIGTDSDNTVATFKGALNILCSGLLTKYPSGKIFFITPYHRSGMDSSYADAIKTICAKYSIPVFDNYNNGGICWTNAAQISALTLNDTYHLNVAGHQWASTKYEHFMDGL